MERGRPATEGVRGHRVGVSGDKAQQYRNFIWPMASKQTPPYKRAGMRAIVHDSDVTSAVLFLPFCMRSLIDNDIDDAGAASLAEGLKVNASVQTLK